MSGEVNNRPIALPIGLDPEVVTTLGCIDDIHSELALMPELSNKRLNAMIDQLDQRWPFMDMAVQVEGTIETPIIEADTRLETPDSGSTTVCLAEREDGQRKMAKYAVKADDRHQFISKGFVMAAGVELADGTTSPPRVQYLFNRLVQIYLPNTEEPTTMPLPCTADIDEVHISSYFCSPEYGKLRGEEHFPEYMEMLEKLTGDLTISQRIMLLKVMPFVTAEHLDPGELQTEGIALSQYVVKVLGICTEDMPFYITFDPEADIYTADNPDTPAATLTEIDNHVEYLASIVAVSYRPITNKDYATETITQHVNQLEPRLIISLKANNKDDDSELVEVCLRHIDFVTNARDFRTWNQS